MVRKGQPARALLGRTFLPSRLSPGPGEFGDPELTSPPRPGAQEGALLCSSAVWDRTTLP